MAKSGVGLAEYIPDSLDGGLPIHQADNNVSSGMLDGLNVSVVLSLKGYPGASAVIQVGTLVGTLAYEQSYDNGFTWSLMVMSAGGAQGAFTTFAASPNAETVPQFFLGSNATHVRIRLTAYTSGSAVCIIRANRVSSVFTVGALSVSQNAVAAALFVSTEGGKTVTGAAQATGLHTVVATGQAQYALFDVYGRQVIRPDSTWTALSQPAVAAQASVARAAQAADKNVCTHITISLTTGATPTAGTVTFNLLDGAAVIWSTKLARDITVGATTSFDIPNLWLEGTVNTAMTLQTAAVTPAGQTASVWMSGTITR